MTPDTIHGKVLAALQAELAGKYDLTSTIRHKGERGRQREDGLATFLRENLPGAYGVATGELFSYTTDAVSPQCDLIIYDRLHTHIIGRSQPVQQVPIEGTYAVIEVKSIIDTNALDDAEAKFNGIRSLWRDSYPKAKDGVSFFLFGYRSRVALKSRLEMLRRNAEEDVLIVTLDAGCSIWVGSEDGPCRPEWLDMPPPEYGDYSALALFFFEILDACHTKLLDVNYLDVFTRTTTEEP